jgi:hypothetical protein
MTPSEIKDLVTISAAFVGLVLSLYNFFERRSDRKPRIKVVISIGTSKEERTLQGKTTHTSEDVLFLEISNLGEKKIYFDSVSVKLMGTDRRLPARSIESRKQIADELASGQNAFYSTKLSEIALAYSESHLVGNLRLRGILFDGTGRKYQSGNFLLEESIIRKNLAKNVLPTTG